MRCWPTEPLWANCCWTVSIWAGSMASSRASASAHAARSVSRLMTCSRMPKRRRAPLLGGELAHPGEARGEQIRRLAPGEVDVDVAGGDDLRRARCAAEVQRRRRLGDVVDGRPLDVEVAPGEVVGVPDSAPRRTVRNSSVRS